MASQTPPDPTQQSLLPEFTPPPKPKSTPLDPPLVYYNQKWRVAPLVVDTQEEADALDPNEWITSPPAAGTSGKTQDQYPKLMFNVNLQPKIVSDAEEEKALSSDWLEFSLPDALCKAAQARNAAKAAADAAKSQAQSQAPSQAQPQSPYYPGQYYQR